MASSATSRLCCGSGITTPTRQSPMRHPRSSKVKRPAPMHVHPCMCTHACAPMHVHPRMCIYTCCTRSLTPWLNTAHRTPHTAPHLTSSPFLHFSTPPPLHPSALPLGNFVDTTGTANQLFPVNNAIQPTFNMSVNETVHFRFLCAQALHYRTPLRSTAQAAMTPIHPTEGLG